MPKLSFVVPVYNTEKQLGICLDSILNQTNKDFEVVLINDGSTDNSEQICKEYIKRYPGKIEYISKENTGIADTRNLGIAKSKGEYVCFVDADDYIASDLLEKLMLYLEKTPDLVKYKLTKVNQNQEELEKVDGPTFDTKTGEEAFNLLYYQDVLMDSPCLYAMNRSYLLEKGFKFAKGRYHEDFGLMPLIIVEASSIISTDIYGYFYIQTQNSIMRNTDYKKTIKKVEDSFAHYDLMLEELEKAKLSKQANENVKLFYTNSVLLKIETLKNPERQSAIKEFRRRKMSRNIKIRNFRQLVKKIILVLNVEWYLKIR